MNNEIGRKITSLTLMTIMLAGGMTIAAPSMMPEAHAANANLYVSAENSQFDNYFSGPQVIEVVVIDDDIDETNEAKGEPMVTINGKQLRMAQATDGNWYGYFADRIMAMNADYVAQHSDYGNDGTSLDFGQFCGSTSTKMHTDEVEIMFSDTVGVAIPVRSNSSSFGVNGSAIGDTTISACTTDFNDAYREGVAHVIHANATYSTAYTDSILGYASAATLATSVEGNVSNVVREAKNLNNQSTNGWGQIGLKDDGLWPLIQLYDFTTGGNVVVQYAKGGGTQSTTLTFDTVEAYASASLDRAIYPQSAQVHVTITDLWLNIDPTDEDSWTFATSTSDANHGTYYQIFDENGSRQGDSDVTGQTNIKGNLTNLMVETNGVLKVNGDAQSTGTAVITLQDNGDSNMGTCTTAANCATTGGNLLDAGSQPITITELSPNSGVFGTYDESDKSMIKIAKTALRGTSATIDYNDEAATILVGNSFATIDIAENDDEWNSGEELSVILIDGDANLNSRADEDLDLNGNNTNLIPTLQTGNPFTLGDASSPSVSIITVVGSLINDVSNVGEADAAYDLVGNNRTADSITVQSYSDRIIFDNATSAESGNTNAIFVDMNIGIEELQKTFKNTNSTANSRLHGFNLLNIDVRAFTDNTVDVYLVNGTLTTSTIEASGYSSAIFVANDVAAKSITNINSTALNEKIFEEQNPSTHLSWLVVANSTFTDDTASDQFVIDLFSFGFINDGELASERVSNQIVRLELEETGDNTDTFVGSLEYIMVNQLNIMQAGTYTNLSPIDDDATFIVIEDLTDEDAPRVNYLDLGADGISTQIADQEAAPSHSGVVYFDNDNYKEADTVLVTLEDLDLNVDSSLIDIYTVVTTQGDSNEDAVGTGNSTSSGYSVKYSTGEESGRMLDITIDDERWTDNACAFTSGVNQGLGDTGFTLVETGSDTGVFTGDFQIPSEYCSSSSTTKKSPTGKDLEVNYVDFRDASGAIIEVGDGAGIRANSGSVSLDRTVYPVPFGVTGDFSSNTKNTPDGRALFPIHVTGTDASTTLGSGEYLANGDLTIHVRVNDPDWNVSATGEDKINKDTSAAAVGPVKISVIRGSSANVLAYAGGPAAQDGIIAVSTSNQTSVRELGPILETAPDSGIFEVDMTIRYTDGPASTSCPSTTSSWTNIKDSIGSNENDRFDTIATSGDYCILQGDILQVEYSDPADASGSLNTVTDSATFDLRNGVLQSDKSVYIIGSDMILTLIEPDFDLDNDSAETYDLDLIEWDSDAKTLTMGDEGAYASTFDPEPSDFRETGDSTGIFQVVVEIPSSIAGTNLDRGEQIDLDYTDWGPSGSNFVGDEDEDVAITVFTSNFGATVELDQKVYTWTDKVYITVVAPDHNFDSGLIDSVGENLADIVKVSTRSYNIKQYKLTETGTDTGIFTGEVILTGFSHDADGDSATGDSSGYDTNPSTSSGTSNGPTDGKLQTDNDDGLTVSFEYNEDETVVGSALIRWNIGEVQWLEASYPASGTGVVRVIDSDMNLDPEAVDNFAVDLWSDSDAGGIDLTVTETNEATGIFEGTVFFTTTDESSGHRLRVAEGDTVTAEYEDNTLPSPYTTADELDVTGTSLIGTVVPPLERAPAANLRTVDAFGNSLDAVSIDQQVQLTADLANGQDSEQSFAYLVQVQNSDGVTVSLAWITGSLSSGQSFSPALSWIPTEAGSYTATAFVWESVDNPTALSPPVSTTVNVS